MTNRRGRGLVAVAWIQFLFRWEAADDISMALPGIYKALQNRHIKKIIDPQLLAIRDTSISRSTNNA